MSEITRLDEGQRDLLNDMVASVDRGDSLQGGQVGRLKAWLRQLTPGTADAMSIPPTRCRPRPRSSRSRGPYYRNFTPKQVPRIDPMTHKDRSPLPPRAVSAEQAGQLLSVSAATIRRLVRDGRLRGIKVNSHIRVPVIDIHELIGVESALHDAHDYREALWKLRQALAAHVREIDRLLGEPRAE